MHRYLYSTVSKFNSYASEPLIIHVVGRMEGRVRRIRDREEGNDVVGHMRNIRDNTSQLSRAVCGRSFMIARDMN